MSSSSEASASQVVMNCDTLALALSTSDDLYVTRIHVVDQPECSIQRRFAINWADTLAIPV